MILVSFYIPRELKAALKTWAKVWGVPYSELIRRAIRDFLYSSSSSSYRDSSIH